jgi:thiamine biosynthesis lipoprotein
MARDPALPPSALIFASPAPIRIARHAMATRFEIALFGDRPAFLRAAAEEALDEVDRIENLLSAYRPHTDIARINAVGNKSPVPVAPEVFRLLERAFRIGRESNGAFDTTAGSLVRAWGFTGGSGSFPDEEKIALARSRIGEQFVVLNPIDSTVRLTMPGVQLDLGSIGKGYALERAADILRDLGIASALLHGGTSTIVAIGHPPDANGWLISLPQGSGLSSSCAPVVEIHDEAISVSATWGKSFEVDGRRLGHVIDPRSGRPVEGTSYAAVSLANATETDAWSTALVVLGNQGVDLLVKVHPDARFWLGSEPAEADIVSDVAR